MAGLSVLEKPTASSMTIAEVAHHRGFASTAHFSDAFTARFGERAGDVRRRAVLARSVA